MGLSEISQGATGQEENGKMTETNPLFGNIDPAINRLRLDLSRIELEMKQAMDKIGKLEEFIEMKKEERGKVNVALECLEQIGQPEIEEETL